MASHSSGISRDVINLSQPPSVSDFVLVLKFHRPDLLIKDWQTLDLQLGYGSHYIKPHSPDLSDTDMSCVAYIVKSKIPPGQLDHASWKRSNVRIFDAAEKRMPPPAITC